jgi:hypothetical protein
VLHSAKRARQTAHRQRPLCRVLFIGHSAKTLPSASRYSAKKSGCHGAGVTEMAPLPSVLGDTRQRSYLCRVSPNTLDKEVTSLPSARATKLGKEAIQVTKYWFFAECYGPDTRQSTSLPSVTLGKVTSIHLFYLFFLFHPNKQNIPHIHHIYHIYTLQIPSQT